MVHASYRKSSRVLANRRAHAYSGARSVSGRSHAVQIFPAIDLRGGRCVRLRQGDFNQETDFGGDPAETALRWVRQGATFLHLVDLDGARQGQPANGASVRQ